MTKVLTRLLLSDSTFSAFKTISNSGLLVALDPSLVNNEWGDSDENLTNLAKASTEWARHLNLNGVFLFSDENTVMGNFLKLSLVRKAGACSAVRLFIIRFLSDDHG